MVFSSSDAGVWRVACFQGIWKSRCSELSHCRPGYLLLFTCANNQGFTLWRGGGARASVLRWTHLVPVYVLVSVPVLVPVYVLVSVLVPVPVYVLVPVLVPVYVLVSVLVPVYVLVPVLVPVYVLILVSVLVPVLVSVRLQVFNQEPTKAHHTKSRARNHRTQ
ncbi:hypothetical protein EYF80_065293 [Liparis tanakae]|uniref:Uncharacterized protein n=1 Tax=Liparis tanakae TaxID=230148 RepID=A0A4Z2E8F0_9TELE|nr:hypothetical protein EYF80_065293 [Liparis tanakae]